MKKKLTILIALIMVLAVALPVLASCTDKAKTVKEISVVNPQTEFTVGDTIDYDKLSILVTYTDETTETKTVAQLKATVVKADLSKAGDSFYSVTYQGITAIVNIHVTEANVNIDDLIVQDFTGPEFYSNYKINSAARASGTKEERGDFRITGETYEVGNANKFIFRPEITALDVEAQKAVTVKNAKTTVKVYSKDSADGKYAELTGLALDAFVTVDDNTYKFSKDAAGKYVKLEISVDAEHYDVEDLTEAQRTLTVEFVVIEDGYNAYDQTGLSVMNDLAKRAWSEIWKCDYVIDEANHKVTLKAKEGVEPLKLEADEYPLYTYVDNISTVILHNSFTLNPNNMPSLFFWTSEPGLMTSDGYTEATSALGTLIKDNELVGSLRSGFGSGETGDREYMRVMDTREYSDVNAEGGKVYGNVAIETGISLNMQKGIFATKKVSVSGNYQQIKTPEQGTHVNPTDRKLVVYIDYDKGTAITDPVTHWTVFQMHQSVIPGADKVSFELRNLAITGNNPQIDEEDEDKLASTIRPAGLNLSNSYTSLMSIKNVNASQFGSNILGDNYGDMYFDAENKFVAENNREGMTPSRAYLNMVGSKAYNAYSNMFYIWRSTAIITNCEFIGSGGPMFILCDGPHTLGNPASAATTDAGGPSLEVDNVSKLQAYAQGNESWYKIWKVNSLFTMIKNTLDTEIRKLGKTVQFTNPDNPTAGQFINVIAAMICEPGSLIQGGSPSDVTGMMDVRGTFTQKDSSGAILNEFKLHNDILNTVRPGVGYNANAFPLLLQAGNAMLMTDLTNTYAPDGALFVDMVQKAARYEATKDPADGMAAMQAQQAAAVTEAQLGAFAASQSNMLCLYMSAATQGGTQYSPYFGIILEFGNVQA